MCSGKPVPVVSMHVKLGRTVKSQCTSMASPPWAVFGSIRYIPDGVSYCACSLHVFGKVLCGTGLVVVVVVEVTRSGCGGNGVVIKSAVSTSSEQSSLSSQSSSSSQSKQSYSSHESQSSSSSRFVRVSDEHNSPMQVDVVKSGRTVATNQMFCKCFVRQWRRTEIPPIVSLTQISMDRAPIAMATSN